VLAIALVCSYLIALTLATAKARGSANPVAVTERASAVLVWLDAHPNVGSSRSRANVRGKFKAKVWWGLRMAGVAWLDRRTGDVDVESPFGCIHSNEGKWDDDADPHWGGIQMDRGFQATYGSDYIRAFNGLANVWPIWAQVVAGYRAYHGYHGYRPRGFGPWSTAGMCGL
jgi:hypothetical protein